MRAKKKLKGLRDACATVLVWLGLRVVPHLPRGWVVAVARIAGRLGYMLVPSIRQVGEANLDLAWQDRKTPREKRAILIGSFQTFALVLLDVLWFTRHPQTRLHRYITFDPLLLHLFPLQPLICVTAHLGNWETVGQAVPNAGYPLASVAATVPVPRIDRMFIQSRQHTGQTIIPADGAFRKLLRLLTDGGRFAILLDQNVPPRAGGVFFPFFGLPAPTTTAVATLALRTQANLLFGFCLPEPDGTYHVESPGWISASAIRELAREEPEFAAEILTAVILRVVEQAITRRPECWLWMYKRWKHIEPSTDPAHYPFYGKTLGPKDHLRSRLFSRADMEARVKRMVRTSPPTIPTTGQEVGPNNA